MAHDIGGSILFNDIIFPNDKALVQWEKNVHALLVVLASRLPKPLLTTDELRRGIESLDADAYSSWSYYEKWVSSMCIMLLERGVILESELCEELDGDSLSPLDDVPKFNFGDKIKIRSESTKVRWRRPHIRCPGYVFGAAGSIVKLIGRFRDPYYLAFRGPEKMQHLYSVAIPLANLWTAFSNDGAFSPAEDSVVLDVYEDWLERDGDDGVSQPNPQRHGHDRLVNEHHRSHDTSSGKFDEHDHNHGHHVTDVGHHHDKQCEEHGHGHDITDIDRGHGHGHRHDKHCEEHGLENHPIVAEPDKHHHSHGHSHSPKHEHGREHADHLIEHDHHHGDGTTDTKPHDHHHHSHDHGHNHGHSSRMEIEQAAVTKEPPPSAGQTLTEALLRLLQRKGVVAAADIQRTVQRLEACGEQLLGATLVATAWKDAAFKSRLLENASAAAAELGITTANPNAPTVVRVMENTAEVHHVVVCTLCSCYPSALLGLSPSWYKSSSYRARTVREPRVVLADFGVVLPPTKKVVVLDSTADCRYLVLPEPPAHIADTIVERSLEELRTFVTRDSMIGVALL